MADEGFRFEDIIVSSVTDEQDNGKTYKLVTDQAGQTWKVKSGKEGALQGKWNLLKYGAAIRLTIGKFKGWDYVEDIASLTDMATIEAARKLQMALRDLKNESIEAQKASDIISNIECANCVLGEGLKEARDNWLRHALRNYYETKE